MKDFVLNFINKARSLSIENIRLTCSKQYKIFQHKLTHLAETNIELGFYHFNEGNLHDAIMRLKGVSLVYKIQTPRMTYCIGRSYLEMNKIKKAKPYIEQYIESGDKEFLKEADFCKKIIDGEEKTVSEMPESIFARRINIQRKLSSLSFELRKKEIDLLTIETEKRGGGAILEINCGSSNISSHIRPILPEAHIDGIEANLDMRKIALNMTSGSSRVYDSVYPGLFMNYLEKSSDKYYDMILYHNAIFSSINLDAFFTSCYKKSKATAILCISFMNSSKTTFNAVTNSFQFTKKDVVEMAKSNGWSQTKQSPDLTFGNGSILIMEKAENDKIEAQG